MSNKKSRFSPFVKQCFVTGSVGLNIAGHGCMLGFPAILLPQLHHPDSPIKLSKEADSWIASIVGVMMLVGSFVMSYVMARFGRKRAHLFDTLPALIGWLITIFASSFQVIFIGRILSSLSFGMMLPLRSVLIGEYASPKNRGAFLTTVSFAQAFGIFFAHLIGTLVDWRKTSIICSGFHLASLLMIFYCPESPSWLASQGRYDECRLVFRWLRGDEEEEELENLIQARIIFKEDKVRDKEQDNKLKNTLLTARKKEFYKPILLMVHAYVMIQFAGGTTIAAYSTRILYLILGPDADAGFWMIVLDTQRIIFNAAAIYVINRVKRRTLVFSIGGLCVVSHLLISLYVYLRNHGSLSYDALWIPVILVNVQYFTVATGMVPLPNVIAGEVFPLEFKSVGGMISMWMQALFMFVVLKTFPGLVERTGLDGTYLVYAGALSYNLLVIWFLLPETKGRTLQEIEDEFKGRKCNHEEQKEKEPLKIALTDNGIKNNPDERCATPLLKVLK